MILDGKRFVLKTHYDILSVKEDADYEKIHTDYKRAVLKSYPGKMQTTTEASNIQHESLETFLMVKKAWKILSNSKTRGICDRELRDLRRDTKTAEDVSLDEMMVEEVGEVLKLFYECRFNDYFSIDSIELEDMDIHWVGMRVRYLYADLTRYRPLIIPPCRSCSLKIRLTIINWFIVISY
ncbi:hypothetical protein MKW92_052535 [Papaver armeniacum]|nr:hypothetical protein MKW92_052535 [Papaver armeniacum]